MIGLSNQHVEFRRCHWGGSVYLAVESLLWLLSATVGTAGQIPASMFILLIGGMLVYPIATACSRLLKMPKPDSSNKLAILSTWIALTIPLGVPLVFMATSVDREHLFFPAFAVLVGAHWLPFAYVYSMKSFAMLAVILVLAGVLFGFVLPQFSAACGFVVGGILLLFAIINFIVVHGERGFKAVYIKKSDQKTGR
ncbi:MAG: hypothetical protein JW996_07220 [Candidatus Cloacimonetes bacterium]|nr:hypothetical protein [Candidatus Cloacimonadota bacterium]